MTIRLMTLLLLFFPVTACGVMPPLIHVEVTVVDDDNQPVEGADAFVAPFVNPVTQTRIQKDVITPENGWFQVSGFPRDGSFYIGAKKEGYYDSKIRVGIGNYLGLSGGGTDSVSAGKAQSHCFVCEERGCDLAGNRRACGL